MTEQNTPETEAPSVSTDFNLSCKFCGSELRISTAWEGPAYSGSFEPEAIECRGPIWCNAEWETNGVLRTKPQYQEYPDIYERPADWTNG